MEIALQKLCQAANSLEEAEPLETFVSRRSNMTHAVLCHYVKLVTLLYHTWDGKAVCYRLLKPFYHKRGRSLATARPARTPVSVTCDLLIRPQTWVSKGS